MSELKKQEPIGFNSEEKQKIQKAVKLVNKNATEGSRKATFSGYVRSAALLQAFFDIERFES